MRIASAELPVRWPPNTLEELRTVLVDPHLVAEISADVTRFACCGCVRTSHQPMSRPSAPGTNPPPAEDLPSGFP